MTTTNGYYSSETNRIPTDKPLTRVTTVPKNEKQGYSWLLALLGVCLVGAAATIVLIHRSQAQATLVSSTEQMAIPTVLAVHPEMGNPEVHLVLPGTVASLMESSVYAQVNGYITKWMFDIGAQVKEGDLLATIDTPVTDQQLKQAQQNVVLAEANLKLAQVTAARYNGLLASHAVSQEDVDTQNANVAVQQATLGAAQDVVSGIEKTEGFKQVLAPFDGVITERKIDVGDYVSTSGQTVGNTTAPLQTGAPNQELFRLAQIKILRVYVNVPEPYVAEIVPGISATLEFASAPNSKVTGKLVRTANAINPGSLTLLSEVDVENPDGKLFPGGYAQVHFDIVANHPPMVIPGNTLIFRAQGTQVGIVDPDTDTVHLKDVKIGRDLGTKLEVVEGLTEHDLVIVNPSDSLVDGQKVRISSKSLAKSS